MIANGGGGGGGAVELSRDSHSLDLLKHGQNKHLIYQNILFLHFLKIHP